MSFLIFAGSAQTQADYMSKKSRWMARRRETLHDALYDSMKINSSGLQTVWEIECEDGSNFDRQEIEEMIRKSGRELLANPPKAY